MHDTDAIVRAYVECSLWSSLDDEGEPLDAAYSADDIDPGTLGTMREDVESFVYLCEQDGIDLTQLDAGQTGHDLWLTRNHHGAGFWDRGLGELGLRLTDAAYSFGGCDLYVGDDGRIYAT